MESENKKDSSLFSKQIGEKEKRKLKALHNKNNIWLGIGMMGMIGWSVAVPTLLGAAFGIWLDKAYPQSFSWTLPLLFTGLIIGIVIAWYWVANENKEMHQKKYEENE